MKRQKRTGLTMLQVREIIRLKLMGFGHRAIGRSCGCSPSTVSEFIQAVVKGGISVQAAAALSEEELLVRFSNRRGGRKGLIALDHAQLSSELKRPGVTLELLWREWVEHHVGENCSYSHFCGLHAKWVGSQRRWMRQSHKAGEKVFIDYSGKKPFLIDLETGELREVELFVGCLGASSLIYAEATESQRERDWISAHVRMMSFFGGVPAVLVPDNLASGVTKACRYEATINRTYADFASHYGCISIPARSGSPKDKGKVERAVQIAQRWILARIRNEKHSSLDSLNARIRTLLKEINETKKLRDFGMTRQELFASLERAALKPLPELPYEYGEWKTARVHPDGHIQIEHHYYSVPYPYRGSLVEARIGDRFVTIFHEGRQLANHLRDSRRGGYSTIESHLDSRERGHLGTMSLDQILTWAGSIGEEVKIQAERIMAARKHPEQGMRAVLGVIRLKGKYLPAEIDAACGYANAHRVVGYQSIKNILTTGAYRRFQQQAPELPPPAHGNIRGSTYFH